MGLSLLVTLLQLPSRLSSKKSLGGEAEEVFFFLKAHCKTSI